MVNILGEDRSIDHCRTPQSLSCRLSGGESSTTSGQGSGTSGATTGQDTIIIPDIILNST